MAGLIGVQTVCKSYQQTILIDKELKLLQYDVSSNENKKILSLYHTQLLRKSRRDTPMQHWGITTDIIMLGNSACFLAHLS